MESMEKHTIVQLMIVWIIRYVRISKGQIIRAILYTILFHCCSKQWDGKGTSYVQGFGERNNMSDCARKIILKTRGDNLQFASSALNMISL